MSCLLSAVCRLLAVKGGAKPLGIADCRLLFVQCMSRPAMSLTGIDLALLPLYNLDVLEW